MKRKKKHKINREFKNSVFCHLFSIKKYIRQLYTALHPEDTDITEDDLEKKTIMNVLTNQEYNDLGFIARDKLLILMEAQSTWSDNIILRILIYFYKTLVIYILDNNLNIYGEKAIKLPDIEFYVLYTGYGAKRPKIIRLSDIYGEKCPFDARVNVITESDDGDIIDQYIHFTHVADEQIRLHGKGDEAIKNIFRICLEKGYLREYLTEHQWEVECIMKEIFSQEAAINMLIYDERNKAKKEGFNDGKIEGERKGKMDMARTMLNDGIPLDTVLRYSGLSRATLESIV